MRRKPYTERGIRRVPCVKCGAPARHEWRICSTNAYSAVCTTCDVELNRMVATWAFGPDRAASIIETYQFKRDLMDMKD